MGLWGLILASVVNVFVASSAGMGRHLRRVVRDDRHHCVRNAAPRVLANKFEGNREMLARLSIAGALVLYISFINLFLSVLRIMGNRR